MPAWVLNMSRPLPRLYVTSALDRGGKIDLDARAAHYLNHVLRLGAGEAVALFNGRDGEWRAEVLDARKMRCRVAVIAQVRPQAAETGPILLFAPLKKARIDFVVEKATELGVAELHPVITERTNSERVNVERLSAIAVEAAEQCGRLTVPAVLEPEQLDRCIAAWPGDRRLVMLDESGSGKPIGEVVRLCASAPPAMLVGPEGGFTVGEAELLRARPFVLAAGLGPRILRAETAALAALAVWQANTGNWR